MHNLHGRAFRLKPWSAACYLSAQAFVTCLLALLLQATMTKCSCSGTCGKHKKGMCREPCLDGSSLCHSCICTCTGLCGRPDCVPRCALGRRKGQQEKCATCSHGQEKLERMFADDVALFAAGAVKFLFCNMLIVTYLLKAVGTRTSIFRRLQMPHGNICPGCSSVLRQTRARAPCSMGPECISYLSRAQREKQEGSVHRVPG